MTVSPVILWHASDTLEGDRGLRKQSERTASHNLTGKSYTNEMYLEVEFRAGS